MLTSGDPHVDARAPRAKPAVVVAIVKSLRAAAVLTAWVIAIAVGALLLFWCYLLFWGWEFADSMSGDLGRVKQWP